MRIRSPWLCLVAAFLGCLLLLDAALLPSAASAQVQRDLQALLNLPFFDKTETRVTVVDPGPLGGVVVRFEVKELPVIRDLQFKGLKSVGEADVIKAFREQRVGVSKESVFDPVKINNAKRVLKELLSEHGHPNAVINADTE